MTHGSGRLSTSIPPEPPDPTALAEADRRDVERVLEGDTEAFRGIVERHGPALYRLCWRLLRCPAEAEEAAQEALARAYAGLGSFRRESGLGLWLRRIAVNLCRDILKRSARGERSTAEPERRGAAPLFAGAPAPLPEQAMDLSRALRAVGEAMAGLPLVKREALTLRLLEGLSYEEMSGILGVREGALKVRVHRARQRLKEALGARLPAALAEEVDP
ncbi:MAG: RNA polymerase sigma factor [Deltaproteobacteria bacterium]|nr:MAG: RNA polymerase sigma factor [Deltaproteobacteria bacterium]